MKTIKIRLEGGMMPERANPTDAAYDLYAPQDVVLESGRQVIDLKFSMELPPHHAATIQPRSGFSVGGMEVMSYMLNEATRQFELLDECYRVDADVIRGLVDEKYRGHVGVIVNMHTPVTPWVRFVISKGTRIAQMQIVEVPDTELVEADELDMSQDRGGGFGHTGAR